MKTKTIKINPDYEWHIEYDGYIYAQLKHKTVNWFWGDIWNSVGRTLCFSLQKNYKGSGSGCCLYGMFFGRCQHVDIQEFDLDTFSLTEQLDKEWITYVNRKQRSEAINKQIENIIDRS